MTDAPAFPDEWCDAGAVRSWIASVLGAPVTGPELVYRVKDWAVTAAFAVDQGPAPATVVFHACRLSLFARSAAVHRLLADHCPGRVPAFLGATERSGQTWTLYRHFDGTPVGPRMVELARAFAEVQALVAALPADRTAGLPAYDLGSVPAWLDELLADVDSRYERAWRADGGRLRARLAIPTDVLDQLDRLRPLVAAWVDDLRAGGWPASIDHLDLHANNAVVRAGGRVLIFDWEESLLGLPFFSLDRLLFEARRLDLPDEPFPPPAGGDFETPTVRAVRDAYLAALPWATLDARRHALDLALALAPIKGAHEYRVFHESRGGPANAVLVGWFAVRALDAGRRTLT